MEGKSVDQKEAEASNNHIGNFRLTVKNTLVHVSDA